MQATRPSAAGAAFGASHKASPVPDLRLQYEARGLTASETRVWPEFATAPYLPGSVAERRVSGSLVHPEPSHDLDRVAARLRLSTQDSAGQLRRSGPLLARDRLAPVCPQPERPRQTDEDARRMAVFHLGRHERALSGSQASSPIFGSGDASDN